MKLFLLPTRGYTCSCRNFLEWKSSFCTQKMLLHFLTKKQHIIFDHDHAPTIYASSTSLQLLRPIMTWGILFSPFLSLSLPPPISSLFLLFTSFLQKEVVIFFSLGSPKGALTRTLKNLGLLFGLSSEFIQLGKS